MKRITLLLVLLVGCGPPPPPPPPITEGGYEQLNPGALPRDAKVIEDLGNGWVVFRLEIQGKTRLFMYKTAGDYIGDAQWSQSAITELSQ